MTIIGQKRNFFMNALLLSWFTMLLIACLALMKCEKYKIRFLITCVCVCVCVCV
jgi:hypothetical protein